MKTKIQVAILWLYGWRHSYHKDLYSEPRLIKKGEYIEWIGNPSNSSEIFYVNEAWERQFKRKKD